MLITRPIQEQDLDDLYELTGAAGNGLTTLPQDRDFLRRRIQKARDTFEGRCSPDAGLYSSCWKTSNITAAWVLAASRPGWGWTRCSITTD